MKKIIAFLLVGFITTSAFGQGLPGGGGGSNLPTPPDGKVFDVDFGVGQAFVEKNPDPTKGYDLIMQMDIEKLIEQLPPIEWWRINPATGTAKSETLIEVLQGVNADAEGNHTFSHIEFRYVELPPIKRVNDQFVYDLDEILNLDRTQYHHQVPDWILGNEQIWLRIRHRYFDYRWGRWEEHTIEPYHFVQNRWDIQNAKMVTWDIDWFHYAMPW